MRLIELDSVDISPSILLKIANVFSEEEGTCLLYSGGDFNSANRSFLFLFPFDSLEVRCEKKPWDNLQSKIHDNEFWVGFFKYEMGFSDFIDLDNTLPKNYLKAYFQQTALILIVDHQTRVSKLMIQNDAIDKLSENAREWLSKLSQKSYWKDWIQNLPEIALQSQDPLVKVKDFDTKKVYQDKVLAIQEMIKDGDVYQVNLSHEMEFSGKRYPFPVFCKLAYINPAPFSAYFKHKDFTIVSSSPERFLSKNDHRLETRPIKGTMPRGKSAKEDLENKQKLLNSVKDQAELLMITDLMRNDLGKISLSGSVKTSKISHLESYTNVYHLLSIIESKVCCKIHPIEIIRACFPGGSITGCPKLMAMKVIQKLEGKTRGIYTGSIGYFEGHSNFDFNIAIRTLVFTDNKINIQLGGAITIDSNAEDEYLETMAKGLSIFESLT